MSSYGNFSGLYSSWEETMYKAGFDAVSSVEGGWETMKTYEPPEGKGFMFSTPTGKMKEIHDAVLESYGGHGGGSYADTMRLLQYIAKVGWTEYETERKQQIQEQQEKIEKEKEIERRRNQQYQDYMNQYRKQMAEYQEAQKPPVQKKAFPYPCPCHMAKGLEGWCGVAGFGVPACDH